MLFSIPNLTGDVCRDAVVDAPNAKNVGDDAPNETGDDDALDATGIPCRCGMEQAGGPPITWGQCLSPLYGFIV